MTGKRTAITLDYKVEILRVHEASSAVCKKHMEKMKVMRKKMIFKKHFQNDIREKGEKTGN